MVLCADFFWTLFVWTVSRKRNRPQKTHRTHRDCDHTHIDPAGCVEISQKESQVIKTKIPSTDGIFY
jgi:hypothetical protein